MVKGGMRAIEELGCIRGVVLPWEEVCAVDHGADGEEEEKRPTKPSN